MLNHTHILPTVGGGTTTVFGATFSGQGSNEGWNTGYVNGTRYGPVNRGKRKGVKYIIKVL